MSSKPKKSDYKASPQEQASAAVASAEYQYFKERYSPLLQQERDKSLSEDLKSGVRGRANADVMQAISGPSYQAANSGTAAGDMAQALTGQLGVANEAANKVQNTRQTNVLATAREQVADAQTGMAQASRLATSQALERARAKQQVADAKLAAAVQIGSSFVAQGIENMGTTGTDASGNKVKGSFFSPVRNDGSRVSGARDRLNWAQFGNASLTSTTPQPTLGGQPTLSTPQTGIPLAFAPRAKSLRWVG
jgi:hypothetical protein